MNFGHPFISPPLLCCYFYAPQPYLSFPPLAPWKPIDVPSEVSAQNLKVEAGESTAIVVSREDLEEEGYEQTKKAWTEEQDQLLMKLCSDPNIFFEDVAIQLPGRNSKMCYSRFRRLSNKSKQYWTKAEDEQLKSLVEENGTSWKEFTPYFPGRNFKQLKDHYENFLSPQLGASEWTLEQDLRLIELINEHGQKWKVLQGLMPGRSCSQLKNRFFGRIRRLNEKKLQRTTPLANKLSLLNV